jgi:hypothetical protein
LFHECRQLFDEKKCVLLTQKKSASAGMLLQNGENCYCSSQFVESGIGQGGIKVIKGVVMVPVF